MVLLASVLCLIILGAGVGLSVDFYDAEWAALEEEALLTAEETRLLFSEQLREAVLPLFSLAQFVSEVDPLRRLAYEVGYAGETHALPFASETHRNVTGVCDDPVLVDCFSKIAATIKANAGMDGIPGQSAARPGRRRLLGVPAQQHGGFPRRSLHGQHRCHRARSVG